jgi:tellurite resistance protein TerC
MILLWAGFILFVFAMLALDLGVLNRRHAMVTARDALARTGLFVSLALLFTIAVYFIYEHHWMGIGLRESDRAGPLSGTQAALLYLTGYIVEESLSLDNVFVIAIIFNYFRIPVGFQHRVLFWGILGALVMRAFMILTGTALLERLHWMIYVFGGFLIFTAIRMLRASEVHFDPEKNPLVRLARRFYPVAPALDGQHFFTRMNGRRAVTPLFLSLLLVESADAVFALDSIPAILAITTDPFIVFTSNVFAILGLRSLYFVLANMMERFQYLKLSLVFVLAFVGVKMVLSDHWHIPIGISLGIILIALLSGAVGSVIATRRTRAGVTDRSAEPPEGKESPDRSTSSGTPSGR